MRQWLSMESISRAGEEAPAVAEECPVACSAPRSGSKVRNNDDVEFKALRLMDRQDPDDIIILGNDLCFRFAHRWIVGAVAEITNDVVKSGCALTREAPCDFDQFSDIGDTLRSVLLRHHDNVEICPADDVLKNLGGGGRVAAFPPITEKFVEDGDPHPAGWLFLRLRPNGLALRVLRLRPNGLALRAAGLSQGERQELVERHAE